MDISYDTFGDEEYTGESALNYDDSVPYEDQLPPPPPKPPMFSRLANRINTNKLYLLSDTLAEAGRGQAAMGKRKRREEEEVSEDVDDVDMDGEESLRPNALLLRGPPIAHLPTARIFAFVAHFDVHPKGLEWVDDTTCILVFTNAALCKDAYRTLLKSSADEPDEDGCVRAKPIPVALWPPEERINKTLGVGEGLKGPIRMRAARLGDVKKRGARKESQFYKKHGAPDGEEPGGEDSRKRLRRDGEADDDEKRRVLDAELDDFLARDGDDEPSDPQEGSRKRSRVSDDTRPLSKMRSDYIDSGDARKSQPRSLLERTSLMRAHPDDLEMEHPWEHDSLQSRFREDRPMRPLPRRRGQKGEEEVKAPGRRNERPRKTQQELDDELEAFLNERT